MRKPGSDSAAAQLRASSIAAAARTTAVGRPFITSAAKLGPDRTIGFASGSTSATTSLINRPVACSMPLALIIMGWLRSAAGFTRLRTARAAWAGTDRISASAPEMASSPGSALDQMTTSCPAARATWASAEPQAPAPTTPMRRVMPWLRASPSRKPAIGSGRAASGHAPGRPDRQSVPGRGARRRPRRSSRHCRCRDGAAAR